MDEHTSDSRLDGWESLRAIRPWIDGIGLVDAVTLLAPMLVVMAVALAAALLSMLLVALMTPALGRLIRWRRFPSLSRMPGGSSGGGTRH